MRAQYLVNIPVADLRREPELPSSLGEKDPLQESQLLMGERVELVEEVGQWARVVCPEQPVWRDGQWVGYPGWVRRDAIVPMRQEPNATVQIPWVRVCGVPLSLGSRVVAELIDQERYRVELPDGRRGILPRQVLTPPRTPIATAYTFLGAPYLWGGRSAHHPGERTSVDCSGLVNLVYRAQGKVLPRNAHDQQKRCRKVTTPAVGDLVFLRSEKDPDFFDHVMLYIGDGQLLEATTASGDVRTISLAARTKNQNIEIGRP